MIYLITGVAGNLGSKVAEKLLISGETVRGLVLEHESCAELKRDYPDRYFEYIGDVCEPASLNALFSGLEDQETAFIHCAGIISIYGRSDKRVEKVNVGGTKNVVDACIRNKAARLVYVSSVHALPEKRKTVISEVKGFSHRLSGCYSRTKAAASQLVLDAAKEGLPAVIVHPSGIIGPSRSDKGNIARLVELCLMGKLPAAVRGGFDFVDVRDVAGGIISAAQKGRSGECYILSNRYISIRELLDTLSKVSGAKKMKTYLPLGFAKLFAPFSEAYYRMTRKVPLFTPYSIKTLAQDARFSHKKADAELDYSTRPLEETLADTVKEWSRRSGKASKRRSKGKGLKMQTQS
ncbi:MAG: NAD-dependent epimerase/dehydratase family protein [Clostridia bacterium]|nr:NAD-dependent epimerase/dehydratase family protein [Clostridia bacterium]